MRTRLEWFTRVRGRICQVSAAVLMAALPGCGEEARFKATTASAPAEAVGAALPASGPPPAGAARQEAPQLPPAVERKIIYNAQVDLVVKSVSGTAEALGPLVREYGGYISQADVMSDTPERSHATWKVRIPIERFDAFVAAVSRLGHLERDHVDSQDVTEAFYDLEARVKNKQEEEKRLLRHLADSTGKLDEILVVERELSRVRGEVEQMQGRLRYLGNVTSMSTVTITATERPVIQPPVIPTFAAQIAETFRRSLGLLTDVGKAIVLVAVAFAPWLPILLFLALLTAWLLRRRRYPQTTR